MKDSSEVARQNEAKKLAGRLAIENFVWDGMRLGLGSGTTSHFFVRELAIHIAEKGLRIVCTTTSTATADLARKLDIAITDLNEVAELDVAIDGPDEIDTGFQMIKGGGGCLLWEKIVARSARKMITICDETKIVEHLGAFPLPIEVIRFGWKHTAAAVTELLRAHGVINPVPVLRLREDQPFVTDSGNFILDCKCHRIVDAPKLELELNSIPGVVENGLFTRESRAIVIGKFDGSSHVFHRDEQASISRSKFC